MARNLCSNSDCPSRLDVLGFVVVISREYLPAYLISRIGRGIRRFCSITIGP